jgi:peptidoglycan/LPS O-acetylase OafA/YrhL
VPASASPSAAALSAAASPDSPATEVPPARSVAATAPEAATPSGTTGDHGAGTEAPPRPRAALGYRPELDGLRGIAVTIVVAYHVGETMWRDAAGWFLRGGMVGVDLFFVLSGFLITSLLLAEHQSSGAVSLRAFARRRLLRLVPGLAGMLAAALALALAGKIYRVDEVLSTAGWSLTFTTNWALIDGRPVAMGHLWSVALEGQFYLLWSVVVVLALRARRVLPVLIATAATGIVVVAIWRYVLVGGDTNLFHLYMSTFTRLDTPLSGALVAVLLAAGRFDRLRGRVAVAVSVAGVVVLLVGAVFVESFDRSLYRGVFTVMALAAACAIIGAIQAPPGALGRVLGARPLVAAGVVSYSLYLWHLPIFEYLARETPGWSPWLRSLVGVVVAVVAATLSYRCIEQPFLRRRYRRQTPAPTA